MSSSFTSSQTNPVGPTYNPTLPGLDDNTRWRFIFADVQQLYGILYGYQGTFPAARLLRVDVNGTFVGKRSELNFVAGNGIGIVGSDVNPPIQLTVSDTTDFYTATNQEGVTISSGQPVTRVTNGVRLANATDTTKPCRGLCVGGVGAGAIGTFQNSGMFHLADWTSVTGSVNLTEASYYYLDVTSGKLTSTVPASGPCQLIGQANSTTDLDIQIRETIGL